MSWGTRFSKAPRGGLRQQVRLLSNAAILGLVILSTSAIAKDLPSVRSGVEIGNGKGIDDRGGFELGNGRLFNKEGLYKINKVFGKWEVRYFNKFTELTALESAQGMPKTRVNIDVIQLENINSSADLVESGREMGWTPTRKIGGLDTIRKDSVSLSGIRQIEYRIFQAPTEVIRIDLIGPQGDPDLSAIELFQKSLETFEIAKSETA